MLCTLCNYSRESIKKKSYFVSRYTCDDMKCVLWALMINSIDVEPYRYTSTNSSFSNHDMQTNNGSFGRVHISTSDGFTCTVVFSKINGNERSKHFDIAPFQTSQFQYFRLKH